MIGQTPPYLFQAGASSRGRTFAAQHAEALFVVAPSPEQLRSQVDDIRERAAQEGRDPRSLKVFAAFTPITAPTDAQAQEKYEQFVAYADVDAALALFGGWSGVDLAALPPDVPLEYSENDSIQSVATMFSSIDSSTTWTPRTVAQYVAVGGAGPTFVGSAETIVDEMERWVEVADVDGFNIFRVITPGTFQDFADLIVPELEKRGLLPTEHDRSATARERVGRSGSPRLPEDHPGAAFRR